MRGGPAAAARCGGRRAPAAPTMAAAAAPPTRSSRAARVSGTVKSRAAARRAPSRWPRSCAARRASRCATAAAHCAAPSSRRATKRPVPHAGAGGRPPPRRSRHVVGRRRVDVEDVRAEGVGRCPVAEADLLHVGIDDVAVLHIEGLGRLVLVDPHAVEEEAQLVKVHALALAVGVHQVARRAFILHLKKTSVPSCATTLRFTVRSSMTRPAI